jgi:O-antigen/teichoic acid export membrane protein
MRSVLANYLWLALGDTASRVLLFVATLYLGQVLGREAFGQVNFAQAIVVYFLWFANMGLPLLGAREVARDRAVLPDVVGRVVSTRLALTTLGFALLVGLTLVVEQLRELRLLVLGFGLWLFPQALLLDWVYQGVENTRPAGVARFVDRLVALLLVVLLVHGAADAVRVPWAWLAGGLAGAAWLAIAYRRSGWSIRWRQKIAAARESLQVAFPLGLSFLMIQIHLTLDTVMIGFLRTGAPGGAYAEVGAYSAAYKIVQFLLAFAALVGSVLFPVIARLSKESVAAWQPILRAASRVTLAVGLPCAVGGMLLAEPLMGWAWGEEYRSASAVPFRILVWSVATVFANVTYATILIATSRERRYLGVVTAGAVVNLLANLVLIPRYGLPGAASATMASEILVLALFVGATRWAVRRNPLADLVRPVAAALAMAAVIVALRASPLLALAAGGVVYVALCLVLRQVDRTDLEVLGRRAAPPDDAQRGPAS